MKQLELDFGMLTVEQQERVDRFVKSHAEHAVKMEQLVERDVKTLVDAGFRPGIDFVNTFTSELVTEECEFGYYDDAFNTEVTYQYYNGGVFIVAKSIKLDENDQAVRTDRHFHFNVERSYKGAKIECSSLVGSYRAVKPETLFTKLMEYNQRQEDNAIAELERRIAKRSGIAKLQAQYPQATKIEEAEQYVNRGYKKMISVWFADGSRFDFERTYNNEYRLYQVIDGQQLTMTELAELIANRNK
jgi:hypothetical protein